MPVTRRKRANPPEQPENNNHQTAEQQETASVEHPVSGRSADVSAQAEQVENPGQETPAVRGENGIYQQQMPQNGGSYNERSEMEPVVRRPTFRRPQLSSSNASQSMQQQSLPASMTTPSHAPLPTPTHEITLPLGNLLHLAYNPSYTGAEEARNALIHKLAHESKSGGRARCWSCGSLAVAYDHWNTRSKSFGEVGIAFCEICGVWSVL
ncbi:hypothetical protein EI42_00474 [Thermosporothrix hazakensis]|jgi:hypothetical protein|uniref:Uncharacterized protein n=2 Tax=Thermosporothrix TaxID=768650 RepID=A0A326UHF3_THEHA|nr:hypothetical protein [Thermosporothrix hazakensis]PZW36300.1 hypothetical protein EI42_00474 [Thermosporothrix hazakensis]BBH88766.1 hypothetical protein KTC_35170 [Thermosporothrix sp. COM3]GCE46950.1 hypothetical protein KTH_18190 [Thermosporothrix hazakensis]